MVSANNVSIGHTENALNSDDFSSLVTALVTQLRTAFIHAGDTRDESSQAKSWVRDHFHVGEKRIDAADRWLRANLPHIPNGHNTIAYIRDWKLAIAAVADQL